MKKILSLVLTLSIVLGTIGVPVFAEEGIASAKIGVESFATLSDALLKASSMSDEVVVEIYDKVTLDKSLSGSYTSIKFVGKDTDAEIYLDVQGYITASGKDVAFEDLKLSKSKGGFITNAGFMNVAFGVYDVSSVSYNKCVFSNGAYASSGKVTFTNCTFYRSHDKYGLWAYGDVNCTVDGCTFDDYRGIKMYAEGLEKTVELTVKNTNFSKVDDKPAIVLTCGESVTLENNTYSNTGVFELDLDGVPNGTPVQSDVAPTCVNDKGACGVLVDGKIYTTVEQAAEVATSGSTVTLLHNSAETVELPEGVNLNKNGFEAANVTTPSGTTEVTGNVTYAYVSTNANTPIWGEGGGNASESLEFKLYEGEKEIAVTELNNVGGIIDGDVYVTWNFFVKNTDNYWTTEWAEGYPKASMQPDTVKVFVDGVEAGSNAVKLNAPDDLNKIVAAAEDENGFIGYFTTPADAIKAAAPAGTVELLTDVTVDEWVMFAESLSISNGQLITLVIDGMTINGNGNTLTVNSIESANNGARLFYDATSLNINDLTIKCADGVSGGIGLKSGIIKGVTFEGGVYGVLPGEGDVTIEGCTFNTNGTSIYFEDERDNLVVTGNKFNNANDANVILLRGDVQFTNNVVNSGRTVNIVSGSPVVAGNDFNDVRLKVYPTATAMVSNNEINNLVFEDAENDTTSIFTDNTLSETAQAALDAVTAKTTGLSGSGTEEDPYLINNLEDLKWFRDDVNDVQADGSNQYTGKYIKLTADIDLGDEEWTPIGVYDSSKDHINFCGIFDGDGHTISNLKINSSNRAGFFGELGKSTDFGGVTTIKNITFENANVSSTSGYVGVVASNPFCVTFDNVCVKGDINVQGGSYTAVIAGHGYANFNNCSVDGGENKGKVVSTGWAVGGIAGHIGDFGSIFTNCTVKNLVVESSICGAAAIAGYGASFKKSSNLYAENVDIVAKSEYYPGCNGYLFGLYGAGDNYDVIKNSSVENCTLLEGGQAVAVYDMAAAIDTTLYTELQAAVDAAVDGDTITLLCNVTQTDGVIITDKKLTIDLNGKTFAVTEGTSTNSRNFLINGSSVATIKNGIMEAKGDYSSGAYGTVRTEGTAQVTLKDLTLYNYRGNGLNIKACSGTKVDISDTVVYSQYGGGIEAAGGEIELTNVTVDQKGMYTAPYNSMAISVNGGGKVTVNSGIYSTLPLTAEEANNQGSSHGSWAAGVLNSGGTLIINGGTFANGNYGDDSLATAARGLILRDTHGVVEINGGTFNALGKIIDYQNNLGDATGNEIVTIKGGTFNAHPLANTYEQYVKIPEGYAAIKDLNDNYVVGVAPTATVNNLGAITIPAGEYKDVSFNVVNDKDMPLSFVMQFLADQDAEDMKTSPYANWFGDFVITISGLSSDSFDATGCYLAGHYGSFGWIQIPLDGMTINNEERYPVMLYLTDNAQKYDYICTGVQDFKCAMYLTPEVLEAHPDIKVDLELAIVDSSAGTQAAREALVSGENNYQVAKYSYNKEDFVINNVASVIDVEGVVTNYTSLQEAIDAATNGETVTLLGDVEVSESLVVAKGSETVIDLNGFTVSRNQTETAAGNDQLIQNNGTLTIKDSSEAETGKLVYNYTGESVNNVSLSTVSNNCATLIVESGTIENASDATGRSAAGTYMYAVDSLTNSNLGEASVTVNGGVIKSNYMAIRQFVNSTTDRNALVVTDGEIIAEKRAINVQGSNNETKASNAAELNISGGIIKVTSDESSYSVCNLTKSENVAITGGTFIGAIWSSRDNVISGGTFNVEPDAVYAADGYEFVANEDGTYGVQEVSEKTVVISFFNLGLGNDLSMNFYVDETTIEEDSYVLFTKSNADTTALKTKKILASEAASSEGYYKFTFDGLAAKEMGDEVSIVFYNNEGEAISEERIITFKDLCMRTFESNNDSLNTLLVDMLNYGAYTQEHFNYNIDALVNSDLTEEQKAYGSTKFEYSERQTSSLYGKTTSISLELENNIQLNLYFTGINKGMYGTISYMPHDGLTEVIKNVTYNDFEKKGDYYKLSADSLVVADYQQLVTFTIYNEDGSVYEIAKARMEDYGIGGSDMLSDKIMMFAKSAYNYLHR